MTKDTILEVIHELSEILNNKNEEFISRDRQVLDFYNKVWHDHEGIYNDYLHDLVYDMDFYGNPTGDFGDDRLNEMLTDAIRKLLQMAKDKATHPGNSPSF